MCWSEEKARASFRCSLEKRCAEAEGPEELDELSWKRGEKKRRDERRDRPKPSLAQQHTKPAPVSAQPLAQGGIQVRSVGGSVFVVGTASALPMVEGKVESKMTYGPQGPQDNRQVP
ncbi:unnamed protein product [Leuciscus chuanchicus]